MAILIVLILTFIAWILNWTLARSCVACRPLGPISVLLTFFVRRIWRRFLLVGLIRIFLRLLASIAFIFLPLFFNQFVGINAFLAPSQITILLINLFPWLMFLFMEVVFGNLTALSLPMMNLLMIWPPWSPLKKRKFLCLVKLAIPLLQTNVKKNSFSGAVLWKSLPIYWPVAGEVSSSFEVRLQTILLEIYTVLM